MNRHNSSAFYFLFVFVSLAMLCTSSAWAQRVAGESLDLTTRNTGNSSLTDLGYWAGGISDATEGVLGHEAAQAAAGEMAKQMQKNAEKYEAAGRAFAGAQRQQAIKAAGELSSEAASDARFFGNMKKLFQGIDIAGEAGRIAGHLSVGDKTSAGYSLLEFLLKNGTAAAGAFIGSAIPVIGPIVGAFAGEELFKKFGSKHLADRAQEIINEQARRKYSGPELPPESVMVEGRTITLRPDQYYDPKTGLIRQRTPEQQRDYEDFIRKQYREQAKTKHPIDIAYRKFRDGLISYSDLVKKVNEWEKSEEKKRYEEEQREALRKELFNSAFGGSYKGTFSGKASGSINFTIDNHAVSGSISGTFRGDPIKGSFSGKVEDAGTFSATISGTFTGPQTMKQFQKDPNVPFSGKLSGGIAGSKGSGTWNAQSGGQWRISAGGNWSAPRL